MMKTTIGLSNDHFQHLMDEAQSVLNGDIGFGPSPQFPDRVNQRLVVAHEFASHQVQKVSSQTVANAQRLLSQSHNAKGRPAKVAWLLR